MLTAVIIVIGVLRLRERRSCESRDLFATCAIARLNSRRPKQTTNHGRPGDAREIGARSSRSSPSRLARARRTSFRLINLNRNRRFCRARQKKRETARRKQSERNRRASSRRGSRAARNETTLRGFYSPAPKLREDQIGLGIPRLHGVRRFPVLVDTIERLVSGRANIRAAPRSHLGVRNARVRIFTQRVRAAIDGISATDSHRRKREAARRARDFCLRTIARRGFERETKRNETKSLVERSLGS